MNKEKLEIVIKEMRDLYDRGEYEKLNQIANSEQESEEKRIAAHVILQLGPDPRRLI